MRDAILQKAEQQLMVGGYDKLNFATIAKELNTTRANLHYHFKNKETLAIEVTRQYGTKNISEFSAMRSAFKGNFVGFFEAIEAYFWQNDGCTDAGDHSNGCSTLMTDPDLPESIAKISRGFYNKFQKILYDVIQDAIINKEIPESIDPQREAIRCHAMMMGMMTCGMHLSGPEEAKEQLSGLLLDWANSLK